MLLECEWCGGQVYLKYGEWKCFQCSRRYFPPAPERKRPAFVDEIVQAETALAEAENVRQDVQRNSWQMSLNLDDEL